MDFMIIRMVLMFGFGFVVQAGIAAPLAGKSVGGVIGHAVARRAAKEIAKQSVKTGAGRIMSAALAGVTAKQLMGAGVATGLAIAVPVGTYKVTDGQQEVDKARAEVIRSMSAAVIQDFPNHPELACQTLEAVSGGMGSSFDQIKRWFNQALPWACGVAGLGCLLVLLSFVLKAVAKMRRSIATMTATQTARGTN